MKTVFNNAMTAHAWAAQSQESGRSNNGQFYFESRALYSYGRHYVAAYALPRRNGRHVFLTNADSYSVTTSRHVTLARYAIPGRGYSIPDLTELARLLDSALNAWEYPEKNGRPCPTPRPATVKERREALPAIKRHLESAWPGAEAAAVILEAMGQARPVDVAGAMGRRVAAAEVKAEAARVKAEADSRAEDARRMAARPLSEVRGIVSNILDAHHAPESKLKEQSARLFRAQREATGRGWTRIAAAVKERRAIVRAALRDLVEAQAAARRRGDKLRAVRGLRHAIESARKPGMKAAEAARAFRDLAQCATAMNQACGAMLSPATLGRLSGLHNAATEAATQAAAKAEAARMAAQAEYRAAWLAGSKERPPYSVGRLSCATGGALLRAVDVTRDESGQITGGTLETSHGAQVPLAHALRVFAFLKLCRARGEAWQRNGARLRVGHFQVDSVAVNGDFVAGCHRITWAEVARLSEALGVADTVAPADTTAHASAA